MQHPTDEEFRAAGFMPEARNYPRTELEFVMLCAFNGVDPAQAPRAWRYHPNKATAECWRRVAAAAETYIRGGR